MPSPVKPVRSMTGYAAIRRQTGVGELTVSLRAVNHRGLDLHFQPSSELAPFENAMRALLKANIGRGHIEIRAFVTRALQSGALTYNRELLARYVSAFREASAEYRLDGQPDLNTIFSMPGFLSPNAVDTAALGGDFEPEVTAALTACIAELNRHREREGQDLLNTLEREVAGIEGNAAEILRIRATAAEQFRARLHERLSELLSSASLSDHRLIEEAYFLAERSDIQEELTRLDVHAAELRRILQDGGEVGKRIDFLLQEMNRETNTVLSKTSGIGDVGLTITSLALAVKAHIEKIREQALNLE